MIARTSRKGSRKAVDPEARKAEMDALHDRLYLAVDALMESEQWTRYLNACAMFHRYSFNNVLLIVWQCPTATRVAGFQTWKKLGRQVRKGEHGIRILGGRPVTIEDDDDPDKGKTFMRYFPCSVFDISQTDAIEGAADVLTLAHRLDGDDLAGIYDRTAAWLTSQGWDVAREAIPGEVNGYTTHETRRVRIEESLSPAHAAKTILHEAAHAILHDDLAEYHAHRGQAEVEAESVAYVLGQMLGLDTSAWSVGYIAGWASGDREVVATSAANVLAAAHTLAEALAPADAESDENAA